MDSVMIFGKKLAIIERKSNKDSVKLKNNRIYVTTFKESTNSLLKKFLGDLLHSQLLKIYDKIKKQSKVEVFGNLNFEIIENIDNKKYRVAKLRGNKILVKLNAVALPRSTLKYMVTHEIAHTSTKRHTKRFWKTVELMCPDFKKNQELLTKYGDFITGKLIRKD